MTTATEQLARLRARSRGPQARNLMGSVGTGLAGQAVLIVSGVIAARLLGVEDRGHLAFIVLWPTVLSQIGYFGIPDALVYHIARSPRSWRALLRGARGIILTQSVALLAAHTLVVQLVFDQRPEAVVASALLALAATPLMVVHRYGLAVLQGTGRFRAFNVCRLLPALLYTAGLLVLFLEGADTLLAVTGMWVGSLTLSALVAAASARRVPSPDADGPRPRTGELLGFGGRAFLGVVSPAETFRIDQAVVGLLLTASDLGIYVVALAFTNLPRFVAQSVGLVAYPAVAAAPPEEKSRQLRRFVLLGTGLAALIVLGLELAMPWLVPFFFGAEFAPAVGVARVLLVSALLRSLTRLLGDGLRGLGRPEVASLSEGISLVALVPALLLLAPAGVVGAAWAVTVASLVSAAWVGGTVLWPQPTSTPTGNQSHR